MHNNFENYISKLILDVLGVDFRLNPENQKDENLAFDIVSLNWFLDILGVDFCVALVPQTVEQPPENQKEENLWYCISKLVKDVLGVDFSLDPVTQKSSTAEWKPKRKNLWNCISKLVLDVLGFGVAPVTLTVAQHQKEVVDVVDVVVVVPVTYKLLLDVLGVDFSVALVSLMIAQPHKNQKEDLLML